MVAPPFDGSYWPRLERGAWERPEFYELLRRGLRWAIAGFTDGPRTETSVPA
jgi:hypothetical protein